MPTKLPRPGKQLQQVRVTNEDRDQNMLEFVQERNMFFFFFRPVFEYLQSMQGYGSLEDTPLYYFAQWFTLQLMDYLKGSVTQRVRSKSSTAGPAF